jgi:para-nitrobenzyl esterase
MPAEQIQLVRPEAGWIIKPVLDPSEPGPTEKETAWAVIDGYVLREPPDAVLARGDGIDVPLLTGATTGEGALFAGAPSVGAFEDKARVEYRDLADQFLRLYPVSTDAEASAATKTARGHQSFVAQNWMWARMHAQAGRSKTFHYCFDRVPPAPELAGIGAFHTSDIPYVFQTFSAYNRWPWQAWDHELSDIMSSYWINFARSGDPNAPGLPHWPEFNTDTEQTMTFADRISVGPVARRDQLVFWDQLRQRTSAPRHPQAA